MGMTPEFAELTPGLTPEEQLLQARARAYALQESLSAVAPSPVGKAMLICRLHNEHYALDLTWLSAVQPVRDLTPLPCVPSFVAGVLNVRGTVLTVLDLAQCLELGPTTITPNTVIVLTDCANDGEAGLVGLLVDEVIAVRSLDLTQLAPTFSNDPTIRGIAEAEIVVLDLPALLTDNRVGVYDEGR